MRIELAWGGLRRRYLKLFRRGYVRRMAELRHGDPTGCPHEVLDPRDLKFHRNQTSCGWAPENDPFRWRENLPFARVGLAELILLCTAALAATAVLAVVYWPVAWVPLILALFVVWFFRNPRRQIPHGPGVVVSPADGRIAAIEERESDEFVEGPVTVIGIFLSVFNVHINRASLPARVIGLQYRRGKFLNALRPESARENEQLSVWFEETVQPYRRIVVRQIAGAIARRIVCWLKPGDQLEAGEQFGMIKFGSRTELVLPREPGLRIEVKLGQKVAAGKTVLAHFGPQE